MKKKVFHIHLIMFNLFFHKFFKVEAIPWIIAGNSGHVQLQSSQTFIRLISPIRVILMAAFS